MTAPDPVRAALKIECSAAARRYLGACRHWMRLHGHADRLPRLYELLDGPTPAHWVEAASLCIEIAAAMDNPDPGDQSFARQLRAHGTTECLRNASEAIARALTLLNSAP